MNPRGTAYPRTAYPPRAPVTPSQAIVASIATDGKTAGEQIAHAMWLFNGGTIGERELAATIDTALRSYR